MSQPDLNADSDKEWAESDSEGKDYEPEVPKVGRGQFVHPNQYHEHQTKQQSLNKEYQRRGPKTTYQNKPQRRDMQGYEEENKQYRYDQSAYPTTPFKYYSFPSKFCLSRGKNDEKRQRRRPQQACLHKSIQPKRSGH